MSMKLVLRKDVKALGITGDIVTVADGYGRNFLLPRDLALTVTPANLESLETEKRRRSAHELDRIKDFKALAERIHTTDITLRERVSAGDTLYGAVSAPEIVNALSEEDINISAEMVKIDEPIKTLGVHRISIRLHAEVETELKVWVVGLKDNEAATE